MTENRPCWIASERTVELPLNLFDLKGKKALVPGGYGGIGGAIARGLCEAGASVVVAGRSESKAAALA